MNIAQREGADLCSRKSEVMSKLKIRKMIKNKSIHVSSVVFQTCHLVSTLIKLIIQTPLRMVELFLPFGLATSSFGPI